MDSTSFKVETKFPIKVQDVHGRHVAGSMKIKARTHVHKNCPCMWLEFQAHGIKIMNHVRHRQNFGCLSGGNNGSRAPTTEDVDN